MIDMHIHTVHSDGYDTASCVIKKAEDKGLTTISITDHNSIMAYMEDELPKSSLRVIPGVEITCMYKGEVVEVLGYGFRIPAMADELSKNVLSFEDKQKKEFELICSAFSEAGAVFDRDKIAFNPKTESSRKAFLKELNRNAENKKLFSCEESWSISRFFTRKEIYNPNSRLYVDESQLYPKVKTAVDMIHRSGGIAFLAHLYEYAHCREFRGELKSIVDDNKLDGIECAHSSFTNDEISDLNRFCFNRGLLRSGGSDYHGSRKPDIELGIGKGNLNIGEDYLSDWPKYLNEIYSK